MTCSPRNCLAKGQSDCFHLEYACSMGVFIEKLGVTVFVALSPPVVGDLFIIAAKRILSSSELSAIYVLNSLHDVSSLFVT